MPVREKPEFRSDPLGNLRYRAGGVKAYVDGPPSRRRTMRIQWRLALTRRFVSPIIAVDDGDIRYLLDTSDPGPITVGLVADRRWEEPLMRRTLALLGQRTGRTESLRDRVFVDVGANIGTATLCALKRFGAARAVAFEPEPRNFKALRLNLLANDLDARAAAVQQAISDQAGALSLELSGDNVGDHRVRTGDEPAGGALGEERRRAVTVPAVRLDDALDDAGVAASELGLVWIDVQGHEPQVLAGAPRTLAGGAGVLLEYWPYGLRRAGGLAAMHAQLHAFGGEVWEVGEERDSAPPARVDPAALPELDARLAHPYAATNLLLLRR